MTFETFFSPFFIFWGSDIMSFLISAIVPSLVVASIIIFLQRFFFNV